MDTNIPFPSNEEDKETGDFILKNSDPNSGNFSYNLHNFYYLTGLSYGFIGWYPFNSGKLLQIGSDFGAYTDLLCRRCKHVDVIEEDPYRAYITKKRHFKINNLSVINYNLSEFIEKQEGLYDYIVYNIDENREKISNEKAYKDKIYKVRRLLSKTGKLIMVIPNRFAVKYFCGEPNINTKTPFYGMTENDSSFYRFSRSELLNFLSNLKFKNTKLYYPFPDKFATQAVYTDEIKPGKELCERFSTVIMNKENRVLDEKNLIIEAAKDDAALFFFNYFIAECSNEELSPVVYAALSCERIKEKAFATDICKNGKVIKLPLYNEGIIGLKELTDNSKELNERGISTVIPIIDNEKAIMDKILLPKLSDYLRNLTIKDNIADYIDRLYEYILKSSEVTNKDKNIFKHMNNSADWGPILKKAYLEMIPVNCFYNNGELLFFDQEFAYENCPAKYVLFRAISDIYSFIQGIEDAKPIAEIINRYGLSEIWKYFIKAESELWKGLLQKDIVKIRGYLSTNDENMIRINREALKVDSSRDSIYDVVSDIGEKKIVLFGSGKYCDHYLDKYGSNYKPAFIMDNDKEKQGTTKCGIEIKSPDLLNKLPYGSYRVIITIGNYPEIISQLKTLGITDEHYRVYSKALEEIAPYEISNSKTDGKYNIGYVPGVFDLFHIGHLNLLRRSKERCNYLIVGVINDELVERDKHKKPFIPFNERIEIVKQCKYVDRAIEINLENAGKIEAWKKLHYDCLFSGSDYETDEYFKMLQQQLRRLGSNLEFFPYTESTSSTMIQEVLKKNI